MERIVTGWQKIFAGGGTLIFYDLGHQSMGKVTVLL